MGDFKAVFVRVNGLQQRSMARCVLKAVTLKEAGIEAITLASDHHGTNVIDIYREGLKVHRIEVGL